MQRGMGILVVFTVLAAGVRFTTGPSLRKTSEGPTSAATQLIAAGTQPAETSCSEFVDRGEQGPSAPGEIAALIDRYLDKVPGQSPAQWKLPAGTRIVLATVPDPLHTHLNLQFDRIIEALQEAAQDQYFTYDSSWLPWKSRMTEYSSREDQDHDEQATRQRELCPGLILFRKSIHPGTGAQGYDDTYGPGLFVFLVAEQPTTGINRRQWDNALEWIENHVNLNGKGSDTTLRVLGPTFSGSVPSAVRALVNLQTQNSPFTSVLLYTGTIRGCSSYAWLKDELSTLKTPPVRTADFDQNDVIQIDHYFQFLSDRGHEPSEVAILSEDETAYGGLPTSAGSGPKDTTQPTCEPDFTKSRPLYLYYPRDISAVRSAYQEQSIFGPAPAGTASTTHIVLQPQVSESAHIDTDTIPSFSGANSALAQEAELYGVVDSLKAHGIRFVILRSTSTLDYLFLTRFLHRAYPEAFIVTMGPDILFGREIDTTEFRGVATLSAFPLLPRGQDWTLGNDPMARHAHRVFSSGSMEGAYLAVRFLLPDQGAGQEDTRNHLPPKQGLPDYGPPFWVQGEREPVTWLSIIGRDGYWPVAVLQKPYSPNGEKAQDLISNLQPVQAPTLTGPLPVWMRFSLSPAWKFCCALMFLGICVHLLACRYLYSSQDLSMFVHFAPLPGVRQLFLMGVGWAVICAAVILMLCGSAPLWRALESRNVLWIWLLIISAFLGLLGIARDMSARLPAGPHSTRHKRLRAILSIIFPLLLFAIALGVGRAIFNDMPTAYRAVHLTSGVSPMSSLLLMLSGFYWWFWQTLSGLALLGQGRPILPRQKNIPTAFARISSQMAGYIEAFAMPLPRFRLKWGMFYIFPFVIISLLFVALLRPFGGNFDSMLHSFENKSFNVTLHLMFAIAVYLLIIECAQLLSTWLALKRLLLALNRTPLRRTFSALQGLSMHSLWSLSGTTSRARYTIFSHQLESLFHLRNVLHSFEARDVGNQEVRTRVNKACNFGQAFIVDRATSADLAMINTPAARRVRKHISQCAERILNDLLLPDWCEETGTLDLVEDGRTANSQEVLPLSEDTAIRRAEEFICLIYVGYLQNLLARMRTMVLAILGLYAALAFSLAFYPYTPRPAIALSLLLLLLGIGSAVALVYAGLDRDSTLSHITNTEPGTLGLDFWVRLASFIGVPMVGLLVAQFPEIADFIASWVQPSLTAVK
jgi:hypothetical protein